jgi:triosephosphate isomerase (TIM)
MIFLNFKTYENGSGEKAVTLANICQEVSNTSNIPIIPVVQVVDLFRITQSVQTEVFVQHVDPVGFGQYTGWINPLIFKNNGAVGVLLNHSEHPVDFERLKNTVGVCKQNNLKTLVCFADSGLIEQYKSLQPDFLAFEPPELIASKTDSVATKYEEMIKTVSMQVQPIPLIAGAGIKGTNDVRLSVTAEAKGILVSSFVVQSPDPKQTLYELVKGFV